MIFSFFFEFQYTNIKYNKLRCLTPSSPIHFVPLFSIRRFFRNPSKHMQNIVNKTIRIGSKLNPEPSCFDSTLLATAPLRWPPCTYR